MAAELPGGGQITAAIHIARGIDAEGLYKLGAAFTDGSGELLDLVEGLGMLEAAKLDFIERWALRDECQNP